MPVEPRASNPLPRPGLTSVPGPRGTTLAPVRLANGACGILHAPGEAVLGPIGVLCPPAFYEYQLCHRTLRSLAERLAASGAHVLRLDYRGTGDAPGDPATGGPSSWLEDVRVAGAFLADELGSPPTFLFGLRVGAAVAVHAAAAQAENEGDGDGPIVFAWSPVLDGASYAAEVARAHEDWFDRYVRDHRRSADPSSRADRVLGQPWPAAARRDLESFSALAPGARFTPIVLIETEGEELSSDDRTALSLAASRLESLSVPGPAPWRQIPDAVSPALPARALEAIIRTFARTSRT